MFSFSHIPWGYPCLVLWPKMAHAPLLQFADHAVHGLPNRSACRIHGFRGALPVLRRFFRPRMLLPVLRRTKTWWPRGTRDASRFLVMMINYTNTHTHSLSIYLSFYLSIHLSIYLSNLSIFLSFYLSIFLSIYICLYTHIYIHDKLMEKKKHGHNTEDIIYLLCMTYGVCK